MTKLNESVARLHDAWEDALTRAEKAEKDRDGLEQHVEYLSARIGRLMEKLETRYEYVGELSGMVVHMVPREGSIPIYRAVSSGSDTRE